MAVDWEFLLSRFEDGWWKSVDCGKGWHFLLSTLHAQLIAIDPNYKLHQVKEKFGTLRFYYAHTHNDACGWQTAPQQCLFYACVYKAEKLSAITCEVCGSSGVLRDTTWMRVLCDEHANGAEPYDDEDDIKPYQCRREDDSELF